MGQKCVWGNVCAGGMRADEGQATSFPTCCMHMKKEWKSILYFLYWSFMWEHPRALLRCLPSFLSERELFISHSIELQSLWSCDLGFYQIDQRVLVRLTFTALAASPPLCQGSQNSHMLVSKATNRDLSPGRVDRRWMKEHESVAALANCLYFLLNCSSRKLKVCGAQSQKVTPQYKLFCYFFFCYYNCYSHLEKKNCLV